MFDCRLLFLLLFVLIPTPTWARSRELNQLQKDCAAKKQSLTRSLESLGQPVCAPLADLLACWGPLPANHVQYWPCPKRGRIAKRPSWNASLKRPGPNNFYAMRSCGSDGQWTKNETDMSHCNLAQSFRLARTILKYLGNALSLSALFLSLGIFFYHKNLLTLRNQIHCHFFLAICVQTMSYFFFSTYINTLFNKTSVPICYFFLSLTYFSYLAEFAWLLMEGFYIVLCLVWEFGGHEPLRLWNFGVCAWGLPVVLTIIWLLVDSTSRRSVKCNAQAIPRMTTYVDSIDWYITGPIILSLLIDIGIACFFIAKLTTDSKHRRMQQKAKQKPAAVVNYSPALRRKSVWMESTESMKRLQMNMLESDSESDSESPVAAGKLHVLRLTRLQRSGIISFLVLVPFFFFTYLSGFINVGPSAKQAWKIIKIVVKSTQGFVVAIVLCFCNFEVQAALRKAYFQKKDKNVQQPLNDGSSSPRLSLEGI